MKINLRSNQILTHNLNPKNFPKSLTQSCVDAIKRFFNAVIHLLSFGRSPRFFQTNDLRIEEQTRSFMKEVSAALPKSAPLH